MKELIQNTWKTHCVYWFMGLLQRNRRNANEKRGYANDKDRHNLWHSPEQVLECKPAAKTVSFIIVRSSYERKTARTHTRSWAYAVTTEMMVISLFLSFLTTIRSHSEVCSWGRCLLWKERFDDCKQVPTFYVTTSFFQMRKERKFLRVHMC